MWRNNHYPTVSSLVVEFVSWIIITVSSPIFLKHPSPFWLRTCVISIMQHIYTSCHHIYLYRRRACMCCISRVALLNRLTSIKINSEPQTSIQIITVIIIVRWLLVIMKRRTKLGTKKTNRSTSLLTALWRPVIRGKCCCRMQEMTACCCCNRKWPTHATEEWLIIWLLSQQIKSRQLTV